MTRRVSFRTVLQWISTIVIVGCVWLWMPPGAEQTEQPRTSQRLQIPVGFAENHDHDPCRTLQDFFPSQVLRDGANVQYWSVQQQEQTPACRMYPSSADDVSSMLQFLLASNRTFAVSAGRHSSNTGASNSDGSVTIDLARLNQIAISADEASLWVGPGALWRDVYTFLEPRGLTVAGGRAAHVGVGGYVLGGGFSWFSNRHGWTCDTVEEFEVVTPGLEILRAKAEQHPGLFKALKGSLGAFGIVTNFRLSVINNVGVYGGAISYTSQQMPAVYGALDRMSRTASRDSDLDTQGYVSLAYSHADEAWYHSAYLINTAASASAATLNHFRTMPNIHDGLRATTISASAEEIAASNPLGYRRSKFTLTTKMDTRVMEGLYKIVENLVRYNKENDCFDEHSLLGITYQPLTAAHIRASSASDNIFNLHPNRYPRSDPLLLISVELWWLDRAKDNKLVDSIDALYEGFEMAIGKFEHFVYPNYAASWQDPFRSLTTSTKAELRKVKTQYDPKDVWRRLVPGIWHL